MTINIERQKIIEKIIKLTALAEGTNHTDEAESAKRMIGKLTAQYEIKSEEFYREEEIIKDFVDNDGKNFKRDVDILFNTICKYNGVFLLRNKDYYTGSKYILTGKPSDIEVCKYMFDIIMIQVKQLTNDFYAKYKKECLAKLTAPSRKAKSDYQYGLIYGIVDRIKSLQKATDDYYEENALVPVNSALQRYDESKNAYDGKYTKPQRNNIRLGKTFYDGKNDSDKVNLNKGVSGPTNNNLKIGN